MLQQIKGEQVHFLTKQTQYKLLNAKTINPVKFKV